MTEADAAEIEQSERELTSNVVTPGESVANTTKRRTSQRPDKGEGHSHTRSKRESEEGEQHRRQIDHPRPV
jgi:hypothetical protein